MMKMRFFTVSTYGVACALATARVAGADPYANAVVSFDVGAGGAAGFDDPTTALGAPERITGELAGFSGVVSIASPPFGTDELVSIGAGGHLTVRFDEPITDAPSHLFGADLIVFGNAGFLWDFDAGRVGASTAGGASEILREGASSSMARAPRAASLIATRWGMRPGMWSTAALMPNTSRSNSTASASSPTWC